MNRALCQDLANVEQRLRSAARVALFLDYDGTLVPFVPDPSQARLSRETLETMAELAAGPCVITIISGRSVSNLWEQVSLPNLVYAGNHGMEIQGPGLRYLEPAAAALRDSLARLTARLAERLRSIEGVIVECKGLTASIHYRHAAASEAARIGREATAQLALEPAFRLQSSKMAFDIIPRTDWDKGRAALWIQQQLGGNFLPVYVGDDVSDEDAFRRLQEGITIRVGETVDTCAEYCLADTAAVQGFLAWMVRYV